MSTAAMSSPTPAHLALARAILDTHSSVYNAVDDAEVARHEVSAAQLIAEHMATKDAEIAGLRKAIEEAHETLDKSGRLQRRDISHLGLRARVEVLLDIMNDMAAARDDAKAQLGVEAERATHYRDQWQKVLAAGRALYARLGKHDGCSRWGVQDSIASRTWREAAGPDQVRGAEVAS